MDTTETKEPPKPAVPLKLKVMASLAPLLLLMTVVSTVMLVHWRSRYGRLAREKRQRTLALPILERARENLERAEKDLRIPSALPEDIASMAERAAGTASDALDKFPEYEEAWRLRGRALEVQYNFDEARSDYEKALSLHPESPARYHLGVLLTRLLARARLAELRTSLVNPEELRDNAVAHLRRYQAPSPEFKFSVDEKFRFTSSACVAYALGDYDKVASLANTAATLDPTDWLMPYLRGMAAFELKRSDDALAALELAWRIAPNLADPLAWRGRVLGQAGRRGQGIAALDRAIEINPHFLEAYLLRGSLLYEEGRFAEARSDFDMCAQLRPSLPDIHLRRGIAFYESWVRSGRTTDADLQAAEESFTRYLAANPKDPDALLRRARVRMGRRNAPGAEEDLGAAVAAAPGSTEARGLRAEFYESQGKWALADRDCTAVLEKEADQPEALRRRARVRAKAARPDDALADYDRLIARDPNDAGLYLEKGGLQSMAGRADDALATVEKGLALVPRNARLLTLRAEVRLRKGDAEAAIRDAGDAAAIDPQHADALVVRGRAHLERGDKAAALADFRKALAMRPDLKDELAPLIEKANP